MLLLVFKRLFRDPFPERAAFEPGEAFGICQFAIGIVFQAADRLRARTFEIVEDFFERALAVLLVPPGVEFIRAFFAELRRIGSCGGPGPEKERNGLRLPHREVGEQVLERPFGHDTWLEIRFVRQAVQFRQQRLPAAFQFGDHFVSVHKGNYSGRGKNFKENLEYNSGMYLFEPGESPDQAVQRVMRETLDENLTWVHNLREDPITAVHEFRKNIKRARALLRLARDSLGDAAYRRENYALRDAGRLLSSLRDRAVTLETLKTVFPPSPDEPPMEPISALEDHLTQVREEAYAAFLASEGRIEQVRLGMEAIRARWAAIPLEVGMGEMEHSFQRTFRKARREYFILLNEGGTAADFHEWRKRVKYLWYQHELLAGWRAGDTAFEEATARLDHLSDLLGLAHDVFVLEQVCEEAIRAPERRFILRRVHYFRLDHEGASLVHGAALFNDYPAPSG